MKTILILLISVFPILSFATEYKDIQLRTAPVPLKAELAELFDQHGFWSLSQEEFQTIGINQIFLALNHNGYITVKYDVTGDLKVGELEEVAGGQLIHLEINQKVTAFYFKDMPEWKVRTLVEDIQKRDFTKSSTTYLPSISLIPTAHADCSIALQPGVTKSSAYSTMSRVSVGTIANGLMTCLKGLGTGAKDSVVAIPTMAWGALKAVGREAKAFWDNPSGRAKAYYNAVDGAVTGVKNFIVLVGECLMDPAKGARLMKQKLGQVGEYFGQLFSSLANMPVEMALEFICSFVGGIGMDAVIAAFTGGAASGKLLLTLKRTLASLDKLADFMKIAKKLGSFAKAGLDKAMQTKLFKKIQAGTLDMKRLETFNASLLTDSKLMKSYALRGLQCSL